ncbi:MAG: nitrite reductase, copper-containing [Rhodospirillales bacterium]|nr:nitrite reductase, copper-containing [Rhodospirillales bacterium]
MRTLIESLKSTASVLALMATVGIGATGLAAPAAAQDRQGHGAPAGVAATPADVASIVRPPTDLPGPIGKRMPMRVRVDLETVELTGQLDDGTTYRYWTFNRKVPGPFVRVRVGDTVEVTMKNNDESMVQHNVDFHAVTGPGGGGMATEAMPGETKGFVFKAINPGLYVYHCATPMVAQHIASGMYGMILVEPVEGLRKVDREFYVMQGEIYTEETIGTKGEAVESIDKLVNERPEYFVFNGAVGALTGKNALQAKVGETIRIFFGVGGPNFTSSFHVIGEIFDKVYPMGSVTSQMVNDVQTVTVPPGGAVIGEMKLEVPGKYILVDHALSRLNKGLAGFLEVSGQENPAIFKGKLEQPVTKSSRN